MNKIVAGASTAVKYIPKPFIQNGAVEGVKAVNETAGNILSAVFEILDTEESDALDNDFFKNNGHDGESPNTAKYLRAKRFDGFGVIALTNYLDVGGYASGIQATSSSVAWYRINALYEKLVPPSRRGKSIVYAHWYSYEVAMKAVPPGSLEIQMTRILRQKMYSAAGGASKAAITFGTGGWTGYFVNSAAGALQEKLNSIFGQDTQTLAKGIHWFAFLETVVGGGRGDGPARRIVKTIWMEFSLGKGSGVFWEDIIKEPQGWMVIADLIS